MTTIAVIIPALNEEARIPALMANLVALRPDELIVVDGGSSDRTVDLARPHGGVLPSTAGRALQMNAGARAASAEILLFLHADAFLERPAIDRIRATMAWPEVVGGIFDIRYDGND